jgi:ArsR family transcriptional regulator
MKTSPDAVRDLGRCFRGLADPTRLRIVHLLLAGEMCGCDVQYALRRSQSNVSRHLTYLKHAGLVQDRRCGYRVYYRLAPGAAVLPLIAALRGAFAADPTLRQDRVRLVTAVRQGACSISETEPPLPARRPGPRKIPRASHPAARVSRKARHA